MRDIYRELLKRSVVDAASIAQEVNNEYDDVQVQGQFVSEGAMVLYQHRVQKQMMNWQEAKAAQDALDPDGRGLQ